MFFKSDCVNFWSNRKNKFDQLFGAHNRNSAERSTESKSKLQDHRTLHDKGNHTHHAPLPPFQGLAMVKKHAPQQHTHSRFFTHDRHILRWDRGCVGPGLPPLESRIGTGPFRSDSFISLTCVGNRVDDTVAPWCLPNDNPTMYQMIRPGLRQHRRSIVKSYWSSM